MNEIIVPLIKDTNSPPVNLDFFNKVIGQEEVVSKIRFYISSHSDTTPFPTMLYTGSQGLGKNYISTKVSKALGRELLEINCSSLDGDKFIEDIVLGRILGDRSKTILFDEAHKIPINVSTILLSFLNPNSAHFNLVPYKNIQIKWDLSKMNTIFATTEAHKMTTPLKDRCEEIYFKPYTNKEVFDILDFYLEEEKINISCDKEELAWACRNRARDSFLMSDNIKRFCRINGTKNFNEESWSSFRKIFNIYPYGLKSQEVTYLKMLAEYPSLSCKGLAIKMGLNEENIESEIEIRLREINFIDNSSKGRFLTQKGKDYLEKII